MSCVGSILNWRLHEAARTTEQALTSEMAHQARHDALTGLPNRTQLLERTHALLATAAGAGQPCAVLMVDLDRFKEINDVLGHACGDLLLRRVGPLLATAVGEQDVFARLGGDEFAAFLYGADEAAARAVARRLLGLLEATVEVSEVALDVEASIGIALSTAQQALDVDALLQRADMAMYTAKRTHSGLAVYQDGQELSSRHSLSLLGELRRAVAEDQLVLHYQPKVALPGLELCGWRRWLVGSIRPAVCSGRTSSSPRLRAPV